MLEYYSTNRTAGKIGIVYSITISITIRYWSIRLSA